MSNVEKVILVVIFYVGLNFCKGLVVLYLNKLYEVIMVLYLFDFYGYKLLIWCFRFLKYWRVYVEDSNSVKNLEFDGVEICYDMFKIDSVFEFNWDILFYCSFLILFGLIMIGESLCFL